MLLCLVLIHTLKTPNKKCNKKNHPSLLSKDQTQHNHENSQIPALLPSIHSVEVIKVVYWKCWASSIRSGGGLMGECITPPPEQPPFKMSLLWKTSLGQASINTEQYTKKPPSTFRLGWNVIRSCNYHFWQRCCSPVFRAQPEFSIREFSWE